MGFIDILYDNDTWTSLHYPFTHVRQVSLGEKLLTAVRSIEPTKIIDHFYDKNKQKTAREVYEQSIMVAKNLQRLGIQKGDIVVFFCMNNEHVAVLTMGCILIGALVNYFEVHMEAKDVSHVIDILKPNVVLYEEKYKDNCLLNLEHLNLKSLKLKLTIDGQDQRNINDELLKYNGDIDFAEFESVKIEDPENELAFLALTSGSTGVPKIVQITHTLMLHGTHIWWTNKTEYEQLNSESVLLSLSPLRCISQAAMLLQSMLFGIKRISSSKPSDGKYNLELLKNSQVTHIFAAPSFFSEVLQEIDDNDLESLKSLKLIQLGGEAAPKNLLSLAKKHCVNAKIFQCYVMTEMASCITNYEDMAFCTTNYEDIKGGKILPGYQLQIMDENGKALLATQRGQIALRPPYPLKGYKGNDCAAYYNERGLFLTGDYGYVDHEENLLVLARYEDLICSGNLTLIPNHLEFIISSLPEIFESRLTGYRKSPDGTNKIAALFVIRNKGVTAAVLRNSETKIKKRIFETLISKEISPEELAIIKNVYHIDYVPTTTCGKVDRLALKNWALKKAQMM